MEFHGTFMEFHRVGWNSMEVYQHSMELCRLYMEFHGVPWNYMEFPFNSMELNEHSMELHGTPWTPHGMPWNLHGIIPWNSMGLFYTGYQHAIYRIIEKYLFVFDFK